MFCCHQIWNAPWQSGASASYGHQFTPLTVSFASAPPEPPWRPKPVQLVEIGDDVEAWHGPSSGPSPHWSYWPCASGAKCTLPQTGSYGLWMVVVPLSIRSDVVVGQLKQNAPTPGLSGQKTDGRFRNGRPYLTSRSRLANGANHASIGA